MGHDYGETKNAAHIATESRPTSHRNQWPTSNGITGPHRPEYANLHIINARPVAELATAIDRWLAARDAYKLKRSDKSEYDYNATYFALGEAFAERYPEAADTAGAFEWYRRGLIAPEDE